MNWKAEAIDKLRQFDHMRQAVRSIPEELEQLKARNEALQQASPRGRYAKLQRRQNEISLLENQIRQQELEGSLLLAKHWLQVVTTAFSTLTPEEKLILNRFFIMPEKGACFKLCEQLGREESTIYRKRDRALRKFTMALYGNYGK